MATRADASAESVGHAPQQVMSSTQTLEGELSGPNYGHGSAAPPREEEHRPQTIETSLANGVGPTLPIPGNVEGGTVLDGNQQERARDRGTAREVRIVTEPAQQRMNHDPLAGETGIAASVHESAAPERDGTLYDESGTALFDRFNPSPLPGQSPVMGQVGGSSRSSTWFGRLGEYIQRRVEVTAWSSPHHQGGNPGTAWLRPEVPHESPAVAMPPASHGGRHADSASSGSAGISAEMVQAEVSRQLEYAVGDIMDRLQTERQRTLEAVSEAQRLRQQLQRQEAQTELMQLPSAGLPPGAGPCLGELRGCGAQPGVSTDQPLPGPPRPTVMQVPLPLRDTERGSGLASGDQGFGGFQGNLSAVRPPLPMLDDVQNVGSGAQPGVSADQPLPGPQSPPPMASSRTRSQSPLGPKAFFQGLFGLGGSGREGHSQESRPTAVYRDDQTPHLPRPPHVPPPAQPLPPAPGPPAAPATSEANLLATLAKGIESLLAQQSTGKSDRPETVKPGITELPSLPEYQLQTGSIDLLNWITHIGPIMQDLSDTSAAWWTTIMKDVSAWYNQYSSAAPLARLQLRPQPSPELTRPEWARVERRATAMMLSAVPRGVRDEVIAHGQVSSLVLLCKLYAMYQPGNLQEKALVLRMLEQPDECSSAQEAVDGLRRWNLWRRRAMSIGIAEPDASVLLKGLDRITGPIVRANHELSFRVSLIRSTLQVDVRPREGIS